MNLPILLIFFNRPDSIFQLISQVSVVKPKKIYLACDGPREAVAGEEKLVAQLRDDVVDLVDWDCEIFTKFETVNLGCKYNVSSAVYWFFNNVDRGVVLEDDCIPSFNFFGFAERMLDFYQKDKSVGSITGRNEVADIYTSNDPYLFTRKFFCWGWASWSDRVLDNNVELGLSCDFPGPVLLSLPWKERLMVKGMIGLIKSRLVNSWAYPFDLSFRAKSQLCLIPNRNLVRNIGFDTIGAHAKKGAKDLLPVSDDFEVEPRPDIEVENNEEFMEALIEKRYPNKVGLILFSMARYLAPLKRILTR